MQRTIVALVVIIALAVSACGDGSEPSSDGATDGTTNSIATGTATLGAELEGRTFVSTDVAGHTLADGTQVTISFSDGGISANAGCNTIGGGGAVSGVSVVVDGTLRAAPLISTEMACVPDLSAQDEWLSEFLASEPSVVLDGDTLTLDDGNGTVVTLLDRQVADPGD